MVQIENSIINRLKSCWPHRRRPRVSGYSCSILIGNLKTAAGFWQCASLLIPFHQKRKPMDQKRRKQAALVPLARPGIAWSPRQGRGDCWLIIWSWLNSSWVYWTQWVATRCFTFMRRLLALGCWTQLYSCSRPRLLPCRRSVLDRSRRPRSIPWWREQRIGQWPKDASPPNRLAL